MFSFVFMLHLINFANVMKQRVIKSKNLEQDLVVSLSECEHDGVFVLTDENTHRTCWPLLKGFRCLANAKEICIKAGDENKTIASITEVWQALSDMGATRHSCLICLGGGMVTDLGGFAAATFKRGINFINIPTTLLAMVDAAVGGKTGINLGGLKNEIGAFSDSRFVILNTQFLQSLDPENLRSGYAEMLKHALLSNDEMWATHVNFNLAAPDLAALNEMVAQSVKTKQHIVKEDPREQGIRKALNLGHTIGHAIESLALKKGRPMLHGYAVAHGLVGELWLSSFCAGFPTDKLHQTTAFIREYYGRPDFTCKDYDELLQLMQHDKKNSNGRVNFTLLSDIGDIKIDQHVGDEDVKNALDFILN